MAEKRTEVIIYSIALAAALAVMIPPVIGLSTVLSYYASSNFDSYSGSKLTVSGVIGSTVFAGASGVQKAIHDSLKSLSRTDSSVPSGGLNSVASPESMVNPDLLLVSVLISFNAPIIYSLLKREDPEPRYLALYVIPLLVYLIVPAVFSGLI